MKSAEESMQILGSPDPLRSTACRTHITPGHDPTNRQCRDPSPTGDAAGTDKGRVGSATNSWAVSWPPVGRNRVLAQIPYHQTVMSVHSQDNQNLFTAVPFPLVAIPPAVGQSMPGHRGEDDKLPSFHHHHDSRCPDADGGPGRSRGAPRRGEPRERDVTAVRPRSPDAATGSE